MNSKSALAILAAFAFAAAMGGGIYKYVDEKGVTHYSDRPPGDRKPIEIETPPPATEPAPEAKSWQDQEREFQQRRQQREADETKERVDKLLRDYSLAELKRACANARARLAYLQRQEHGPAATRNAQGEIEYYNFEQRGQEMDKLGKFIDRSCPPA